MGPDYWTFRYLPMQNLVPSSPFLSHWCSCYALPTHCTIKLGPHSTRYFGCDSAKFQMMHYSENYFFSWVPQSSIVCSHFQLKEQLWLAETHGHFGGAFTSDLKKHDVLESTLRHMLSANWQRKMLRSHLICSSEAYYEYSRSST